MGAHHCYYFFFFCFGLPFGFGLPPFFLVAGPAIIVLLVFELTSSSSLLIASTQGVAVCTPRGLKCQPKCKGLSNYKTGQPLTSICPYMSSDAYSTSPTRSTPVIGLFGAC
jgi:hypothetical protein